MPFTEFCCRAGGSNLNAGSRNGSSAEPGTSADFTYAGGAWVAATGVFTVASGNPSTDGVAVGDFASVYAAGATVTGFVGRVTAVSATTITVSILIKAGTVPVDGTYTVAIGGAWQGPNGASMFPFGFAVGTLVNTAGNGLRVNIKNDQTYNVTAGVTSALNGALTFQGYASSYGDKGRATIDGGNVGTAFVIFTNTGLFVVLIDLIFNRNGLTGTQFGLNLTGSRNMLVRVQIANMRSSGISGSCDIFDCEANNNNGRGFSVSSTTIIGCVAHHNTIEGFNSTGLHFNCISYKNSGAGFSNAGSITNYFVNCDAYDNNSHGFSLINAGPVATFIENCNAVSNNGYGIFIVANGSRIGNLRNCGFSDNTSGEISLPAQSGLHSEGHVSYPAGTSPWIDPDNADFRLKNSLARGGGVKQFSINGALVSPGHTNIGSVQDRFNVPPTFGIGI